MRVPQKGDIIIQRVNSSEWTIASVVSTPYETALKMKSNRTTRTVTMKLHNMHEYKFVDTGEWLIPRKRSNGWSDEDKAYLVKHYKDHGIDRLACRFGRERNSVITAMYRIKKDGLVEHYASM